MGEADKEGSSRDQKPLAVVVIYPNKARVLKGAEAEAFVEAELRTQLTEGPHTNGWPHLNWTEVPTSKLPEILNSENNHH